MRYLIVFLLVLGVSCRPAKPKVITEKVTETITETVHDTVFEIQADTATLRALIECQNQKPVIKRIIEIKPGKTNLNAPKLDLKDNVLQVDCEAKAQQLFAEWKSKHTVKESIIEVPVYIEKEFTFFQKVLLWLGRILLGLIVLATGYFLIKTYTKFGL